MKMKAQKQHERFQNGKLGDMNASRLVAKQYFEQGSIRNSAHDEEFFNYFLQYLEEAIRKLKE